jgi:hypothetical protein
LRDKYIPEGKNPMDTLTLIWLFPVAFMFHDFEEIIFWEVWLNKHGDEIKKRVPAFLAKPIRAIVEKKTAPTALTVCLIFGLTVLASFLAVEYGKYGFFLAASGVFFVHGFMHLGQSIILRKYVPAVITSALIVIPYGLVLYGRLIKEGIVSLPELLMYFLLGVAIVIPLILVIHKAGDSLYAQAVKLLIH